MVSPHAHAQWIVKTSAQFADSYQIGQWVDPGVVSTRIDFSMCL